MSGKKSLGKKDLAKCLVNNCKVYDTEVEALKAVDSVINCLSMNLEQDNEIAIIGFGKFSVSERAARKGRNPQTGAEIDIAASKNVSFKAGKSLKDAVNK